MGCNSLFCIRKTDFLWVIKGHFYTNVILNSYALSQIFRLWLEVTNEVYQLEFNKFLEEREKIEMETKQEMVSHLEYPMIYDYNTQVKILISIFSKHNQNLY